jgi:uncharacterized protein YkwD
MLVAVALATVVVCAAAPAANAGTRQRMIGAINYVRGLNHRHQLHYSSRLSRAAAAWARNLMRRQTLMHASGVQGEVIEWHTGGGAMVTRTVREWWHSSGHRAVMLGHYRRAGAGRAVGYYGGRRCTIWVVRFAR